MGRAVSRRALTENERSVMWCLAVGAWAERTASSAEAAEELLEKYTLYIDGTEHDIELYVGGELLIRAPRAWMATIDGSRR
mgnify:CR=1 FL=1